MTSTTPPAPRGKRKAAARSRWGVERVGKKSSSKGLVVTGGDMARHRRLFRAYSLVYPLVWSISRLDAILPAASGYMLIASAVRNE